MLSYRTSQLIYDVFEPNYLKDALAKEFHLGNLIFGDKVWESYGKSPGKPNALSCLFIEQGSSQIIN